MRRVPSEWQKSHRTYTPIPVPTATFVARGRAHPLIMAFAQHVADFRRKRLDDSILT
ncbi:MAG: hypothetical protein ABSA80_19405 [Terriglobales bacterium]